LLSATGIVSEIKEYIFEIFQKHKFCKIDVGGSVAILVFNKDLNIK